jgi:hypothetical protein
MGSLIEELKRQDEAARAPGCSHLRAVISNGYFREYWRFHLKREHERLYPEVKQGQYALGA